MHPALSSITRKTAHLSSALGMMSLLFSLLISALPSPAGATGESDDMFVRSNTLQNACTPPNGFEQTKRLHYKYTTEKMWTFQVEEPEMDVTLEFFYFQDYDPQGCPFDCSKGECQTEEVGEGISPFGSFEITDGKEGADGGSVRQSGRLTQGTHQASFWVTSTGSINIGLRVHKQQVPPTATAVPPSPTATDFMLPPIFTPTATATEIPVVNPPQSTPTETPTEVAPPAPTATATEMIPPPAITQTDTPPTSTDQPQGPRKTATPVVFPPVSSPTLPATLPPPASTQAATQPAIIPVTGANLVIPRISAGGGDGQPWMNVGIGLLGLAFILFGVGGRIGRK